MSLDVFGRSFKKIENSIRGPPGVGFKYTTEGNFNVENKKLCNVAEALSEGDATNLSLVKKIVSTEVNEIYKILGSMRSDILNNNIKIIRLEDSVNKYMHNLKISIERNIEWLTLNKEFLTQLDKRLSALE